MVLQKPSSFLVVMTALLGMVVLSAWAFYGVVVEQSYDLVKVFAEPNRRYIIKNEIDLGGKKIVIGEGSTLVFKGGNLSNGTVVGNNTIIKARNYEIFKRGYVRYRACIEAGSKRNNPPTLFKEYHNCLVVEGTWKNTKCGTNWTGLENNSREDVMLAVRNFITLHQVGATVKFPMIDALGYGRVILPGEHIIDFNNSSISYPDDLGVWEDQLIALPEGATPCPLESGYGLITVRGNTIIKNLSIDGKSTYRQDEPVRLGVSCIIAVGNAQNVVFDNVSVSNVLGPAVTARAGAKDILYRDCKFFNIGEHVVYSHQHKGFCHFENCTFDTWDSKRVSEYRGGVDFLYKHVPHYEDGEATYEELYRFDLSFLGCTINNPHRVNSQGRILGAFFTGTFPAVIKVSKCIFSGASPAVNPGKGCSISEDAKMAYRLVVRNCNGAPYIYSSKLNSNIIAEFYDCENILFRTVYAKRYERCKLFLDGYESNNENVTSSFMKEFSEPLVIKDSEFLDRGLKTKTNHPLIHRPIVFDNCKFTSTTKRVEVANLVTVKADASINVTFRSCVINMKDYRLVGGKYKKNDVVITNCDIKTINSK